MRDHDDSLINRSELLDRVGGDTDLLKEITSIFLTEYPALLADVRSAAQHRDAHRLERAAHNLKGCAANFGAEDVTAACYELEQMARQDRPEQAPAAVLRLEAHLEKLRPALVNLLS